MNLESYERLTPQEREELALCGRTTPEQLDKCSVQQLIRDLQQAQTFFPDKEFTLTAVRISDILAVKSEGAYTPSPTKPVIGTRSAAPTTGYKQHGQRPGNPKAKKKEKHNRVVMHSPVRCSHPFTALAAAFFTLFLLVPVVSIVVFPILMATDNLPQIPVPLLASGVFGVPCLVYICIARRATCPVCHMRIFRFSHYNRNRAAHHLPLLGYNFTTALHLLFFWRYNCPGCGTPVKLTGTKGHRTHC